MKHDKFAGTMAGSTPSNEQKNINFSINNIFQAKSLVKEEVKKIDLFSLRMSSSFFYKNYSFIQSLNGKEFLTILMPLIVNSILVAQIIVA